MNRCCGKTASALFVMAVALLFVWSFGLPAAWLGNKSGMQEPQYSQGWAHGCESGISAYAPLRGLLAGKPFVKDEQSMSVENYKMGWNEGFTVCRFTQGAWFDALALVAIVAALIMTRSRD